MYPLDGSLFLSFPFTNYIKTFYRMTNDPPQKISLCVFLSLERYLPSGSQHVSREIQLIEFPPCQKCICPLSQFRSGGGFSLHQREVSKQYNPHNPGICSYFLFIISNSEVIHICQHCSFPASTGTQNYNIFLI